MTSPAAQADDVAARVVSVKAGEFLFRQGDAGSDMFIVQQGSLELLKTREGASEPRRVQVVDVGDVVGDLSLFTSQPRNVGARALAACQLLRVDEAALRQLIAEEPEIAVRLMRQLSIKAAERLESEDAALATGARAAAGSRRSAPASASGATIVAPRPVVSPSAKPAAEGVPTLVHHGSGTKVALPKKPEILVGRPDKRAGSAPDVDLSPFDTERTLSRNHARLVVKADGVYVRDEPSARNGTFVNGQRVAPNADVRLADGDRVRFGAVDTIYRVL